MQVLHLGGLQGELLGDLLLRELLEAFVGVSQLGFGLLELVADLLDFKIVALGKHDGG